MQKENVSYRFTVKPMDVQSCFTAQRPCAFIGFPITISKPRILSFGCGSGNNKELFYTLHFSLEPDTSSSTMVTIIVTRKKNVKIIFVWLGYCSIVKYHQNVNFEESDTEPSLGRNDRFSLLQGILNNVYQTKYYSSVKKSKLSFSWNLHIDKSQWYNIKEENLLKSSTSKCSWGFKKR